MKRRSFVVLLALASLVPLAAGTASRAQTTPLPASQTPLLGAAVPKFADPLPVLSLDPAVAGVQVALGTQVLPPYSPGDPLAVPPIPPTGDPNFPNGLQEVTVNMCEFTNNVLSTGTLLPGATPGPTHVWGYRVGAAGACPGQDTLVGDSYIGPVIVAQRGVPTRVKYVNMLGDSGTTQVLAYQESTDLTLMWADPLNNVDPADPVWGGVGQPAEPMLDGPWSDPAVQDPWLNDVPPPPELNYCAKYAAHNPDGSPVTICNGHYVGPIPAAPHLHGGEIPAVLDGGPDAWWTQTGIFGHGYYSLNGFADAGAKVLDAAGNPVLDAAGNPLPAGQAIYTYPNTQEAAPIWFHDHVLGATRLNVYAGIAGAYMITEPDPGKTVLDQSAKLATGILPLGLDTNGDLTTQADELLIPIVLQDRMFDQNGELYFPAAGFGTSVEHPYWVPEFVGDTIVVNGKTWPFLDVAPKRYRFLFLNGSNARAYELYLVDPAAKVKVNKKLTKVKAQITQNTVGPALWVIGNDQGYLDAPVMIDPLAKTNNKLVIMPGERYEVVIDFAGLAGLAFEMRNTAAIPYPFGGPVVPGQDDTIMRFNVNLPAPAADLSYNPATLAPIRAAGTQIDRLVNAATGTLAPGVTVHKTRRLTLNEFLDPLGGPIELLMNNTKYTGDGNFVGVAGPRATEFFPVVTRWNESWYSELPNEGETEIWEIVNFSADAHPIHPHLVAFQILNRQPFNAVGYQGIYDASFPGGAYDPGAGPPLDYNCGLGLAAQAPGILDPATCVLGGNPDPAPFFLGPAVPPLPAEQGWKDAAISYPGEILRMVIRFTPQTAGSIAYEFDPSDGHGYVWHCHIIDHEDNEMMRPYNVALNPAAPLPAARPFQKGVQY